MGIREVEAVTLRQMPESSSLEETFRIPELFPTATRPAAVGWLLRSAARSLAYAPPGVAHRILAAGLSAACRRQTKP